MSEVNQAGYTELRQYVRDTWSVQLYDGAGETVLTLDESDSRVTVSDSHPNLTFIIALTGEDADITVPVTVSGARLVSGGITVAPDEAFAEGDASLAGDGDEVSVTSTFTMPSSS